MSFLKTGVRLLSCLKQFHANQKGVGPAAYVMAVAVILLLHAGTVAFLPDVRGGNWEPVHDVVSALRSFFEGDIDIVPFRVFAGGLTFFF